MDGCNYIEFTKIYRLGHGFNPGHLAISHSDQNTRMFSMLVGDYKWILMHARVILSTSSNSSS